MINIIRCPKIFGEKSNETPPRSPLAPAANSIDMQPIVHGLYWLRRPECQLLAEGGTRGDRACSLPIGETHLYHHGQGLEDVLKNKT